jgi:hypothetical protein
MNELCTHYNLDECIDRKLVIDKLKSFKKEGKLEYTISGEILKVEDIDLEDSDIDYLIKLFSDNDIFEDEDIDEDFEDFNDFDDDDFDEEY